MQKINNTGIINERLSGIVDRVTFHNPDNGWSVLRVNPFDNPLQQETVVVHQTQVFAGATMEFQGTWTVHPRFGRQFQATKALEKKPATTAALEKYLGSGLIKGVGPKTAKKIVRHFKKNTLDVFEKDMDRLIEVPGIADKKLEMIREAWLEHSSIREVMMFLQSHGISTLFAVRIYKTYGDDAITLVMEDPFRLAADFYGIGFFSADRVALSMGFAPDSPRRIMAGIKHVLAAARNFGHCYLTRSQIHEKVKDLLQLDMGEGLDILLESMVKDRLVMVRQLVTDDDGKTDSCYYSKSLYFDELYVAKRIAYTGPQPLVEVERVERWIFLYCKTKNITLSDEQARAVKSVVCERLSILTGGPGCGKTTTTLVIVKLIESMGLKVLLAAPTGRAAQRMTDVIGKESKTIHRLLEWKGGSFQRNQESPLNTDFLIVDECSMLDISITASLFKAVPENCQILLIGDADQLPSVGAGNVLGDIIASKVVPSLRLTEIFRQAGESCIIRYAHQINQGKMPWIESPFKKPRLWQGITDCMFIDSDEATKEQLNFITRVKRQYDIKQPELEAFNFKGVQDKDNHCSIPRNQNAGQEDLLKYSSEKTLKGLGSRLYEFRTDETGTPYQTEIDIPVKFRHVDIDELLMAGTRIEELLAVVKKVHPWSSLHYGYSALDVVKSLYQEWIPKYYGNSSEIQIISPMTRGSLGTLNLNRTIQAAANPYFEGKKQIKMGQRIFRVGDRVIHLKNNYSLGVYNGDIGVISDLDPIELTCTVEFYPDARPVQYQRDDIMELDLAYAITIHKSQGSEFDIVIIPILTQHFKMLFKNLLYTGITRARKLTVFVGTRRAMSMAVRNRDISLRQTALKELLKRFHENRQD